MSSDKLRSAAKTLRQRAEAATSSPWVKSYWTDHAMEREPVVAGGHGAYIVAKVAGGDAAYIATMHPGLGLALAAWLDVMARSAIGTSAGEVPYESHALRIADLILGSTVTPPPCDNHRETQHRDKRPPWCETCGWNHGRPAIQPFQVTKR